MLHADVAYSESIPFKIFNSVVAIKLVCNPYFLTAWFFHQFHAGLVLLSADLPTHLQENDVM